MDINTGTLPIDQLGNVGNHEFVTLSTQAKLCKELLQRVPTNDFGLPVGIYRPDILPRLDNLENQPQSETGDEDFAVLGESDTISGDKTGQSLFISASDVLGDDGDEAQRAGDLIPKQRSLADQLPHAELQAAYVPLTYDEGYPTLPHGSPLWGQFPFEPPKAYEVFQEYLKMAHESGLGVRMLSELPNFASSKGIVVNMSDIHEYYHLFYWGTRARAFDMFQLASLQKQQELRSLQVTDTQFKITQSAMEKLKDFLEDEEDFWDMMTPKTAVDLLKAASAIQRTSVGLPASGPPQHKPGEDGRGASMEFILRQFAQKGGNAGGEGDLLDESGTMLDNILGDPEAVTYAQELIMRMNKNG